MKNKILALVMVFALLPCSGNLMAEERAEAGSQKQRFEVAAMAGLSVGFSGTIREGTNLIGSLSLGWHITPVFEVEPNVVGATGDAVFSLNLNANIPRGGQLVPYLSGGLGVCVHGAIFFNAGGGLKVGIRDRLSLRGEFKYFSFEEEGTTYGGGLFLAGISYSF
jgi:hypothetical protein